LGSDQILSKTSQNRLSKPAVLVLLSDVAFGGIAVQARDQASYLKKYDVASSLLLLNSLSADRKLLDWYNEFVNTEELPINVSGRWVFGRVLSYLKCFHKRSEAIFHFHCFSQEFMNWEAILAARLAGKQVVATLHHTVGWNRRLFDPGFIFQRLAWKLASRLIVTTQAGKELVEQKAPRGITDVIPCMIQDVVSPIPRDRARRALDVSDHDFLVVVISRLAQSKGLIDLVNAVRALGKHRQMRLMIAGDGPCRGELSELIKDDQRIRLLGHVREKSNIFAAADLFALPSYEEGFGMVYAEAARHGVPSIASDLPQVREVVVDGETGWLVQPGNVERIRTTIDWAYTHRDECLRRGENAKSYCRRFDPEVVMARQILIYDDLLKAI
jgi:glycosyltransferase involved in cell wall biosynthesis